MSETTTEFTLLWGRSQRRVMAYIRSAVNNEHDAEDLYQEAVVVAAKQFDTFDRNKTFTPWVLGISRNLILNYYRTHRQHRTVFTETALSQVADAISGQPEDEDERIEALRGCMSQLSQRDRLLLDLRYSQGVNVHAIARELKTSQNAISVLLYRVRRGLLTCIEHKIRARTT